jgi:hypothetical protein
MTADNQNIPYNPDTEEAQKAIGSYNLWSSADVVVDGDVIRVRIVVNMRDRWNFNRGADDIATGIADAENGRFAEFGWARGFNTYGHLVREVEWRIGAPTAVTITRLASPSNNRFGW